MATITLRIPGGRAGHFIAGAAAASVLSGVALAVTSANFTYQTAQTGFLTVSPTMMTPADSDAAGGQYYIGETEMGSSSSGCFVTGLNFPKAATVKNFTLFFKSGNLTDIAVKISRKNLQSNAVSFLVFKTPVENSGDRQAFTYPIATGTGKINNQVYYYDLRVCLGTGTTFNGGRFTYTYTTAGD